MFLALLCLVFGGCVTVLVVFLVHDTQDASSSTEKDTVLGLAFGVALVANVGCFLQMLHQGLHPRALRPTTPKKAADAGVSDVVMQYVKATEEQSEKAMAQIAKVFKEDMTDLDSRHDQAVDEYWKTLSSQANALRASAQTAVAAETTRAAKAEEGIKTAVQTRAKELGEATLKIFLKEIEATKERGPKIHQLLEEENTLANDWVAAVRKRQHRQAEATALLHLQAKRDHADMQVRQRVVREAMHANAKISGERLQLQMDHAKRNQDAQLSSLKQNVDGKVGEIEAGVKKLSATAEKMRDKGVKSVKSVPEYTPKFEWSKLDVLGEVPKEEQAKLDALKGSMQDEDDIEKKCLAAVNGDRKTALYRPHDGESGPSYADLLAENTEDSPLVAVRLTVRQGGTQSEVVFNSAAPESKDAISTAISTIRDNKGVYGTALQETEVTLDTGGSQTLGMKLMKNPVTSSEDAVRGVCVKSVDVGGQAEKSGAVKADDIIIEINGTNVETMLMKDVAPLIKEAPNNRVKFKLRTVNTEMDVRLSTGSEILSINGCATEVFRKALGEAGDAQSEEKIAHFVRHGFFPDNGKACALHK